MSNIDDIRPLLELGIKNKPKDLIISDLKWKFLIRNILRCENILMVGPTGCGKTLTALYGAKALSRPMFKFDIGATQDARTSLIGKTCFKKDVGTLFNPSPFISAITTPNAVVILEELTRGSHDAWNILLPATDPLQRNLRLDESDDGPVVNVDKGVTFVATANIGSEYTATKVLDKAISNRFPIKIEMEQLNSDQLKELFSIKFSSRSPEQIKLMDILISISEDIRIECKKEDAHLTTMLSPRTMVNLARLVLDGFSLSDISEVAIYPEYSQDDGPDGERTFVKQIIQSYIPVNATNPIKDPRIKK